MSQIHLCKDCGQPMEAIEQPQRQGGTITLVTCKRRECDLWSVTLSTQQYAELSDEKWDSYRQMVKKLKSFYKQEHE